jgi:hypothetical protein
MPVAEAATLQTLPMRDAKAATLQTLPVLDAEGNYGETSKGPLHLTDIRSTTSWIMKL